MRTRRFLMSLLTATTVLACADASQSDLQATAEAQCEANPAPPSGGFTCDGGCCLPEDPADGGSPPEERCDAGVPGPICIPCSPGVVVISSCLTFPLYCPGGVPVCPPGHWELSPDVLADAGIVSCTERRGQLITKQFCLE